MSRWQSFVNFMKLTPDLPTRSTYPDAVRSVDVYEWGGSRRTADWTGIAEANLRTAWSRCATAYACVTLLADAVAESPLRVYETIDGELEERPDHRARTLLANPNPILSEAEFMALVVMTMAVFGYAPVEKVRSGARVPVELWPLRPDWLRREFRTDGTRQYVYRKPGDDPRVIEADDLIVIPYRHDVTQESLGISPLAVIAREIGVDVALTELLKVFIDEGGVPPWAVKMTGDFELNQAEKDAFRESWRQMFGGGRAYKNIGVLNPGMDLVKVGDSIGDMAWPDLRGITEAKIAQAFRVPLDLVQARESMKSGGLTTTEMDGAMAFLQNHGAQPLRTRIDGAFSRGLLPDFTGGDRRFSLEFDTSGIMALQEDRDALHSRIRADWQAGLITLNEARRETARADLGTDGEVFMQTFTTLLVSASELISAPDPQPAPVRSGAVIRALPTTTRQERVYRDLKALSPGELEVRAQSLARTNRERNRLAEIAGRKLRAFFREQGQRVISSLRSSADVPEIRADLINWNDEEDMLREILMRLYGSAGESAFGHIAATVGVELSWTISNPNIARIMDELGKRIVGISDTTRQDVVRVITDGQADGLSLQQIADKLEGMFTETYKNRALTIARTETAHSYSTASLLGYQESGVVSHVEFDDNSSHDEDPLPPTNTTCADRAGLVVPVDEAQPYVDSAHVNCVLATIPIIAKPLGEI